MNKLINVNIKNENGKLLVGSRDIAVGLEKEHKDVLRKIEDVLTVGEAKATNTRNICLIKMPSFCWL